MVVRDSDLQIRKTSHSSLGISSLGGGITGEVVLEGLHSLWDEVQDAEMSSSVVGEYEVRCVGIYNNSPNNETFVDLQVYIHQNTASPYTDIDIAPGIAAPGDEEPIVANENTLPPNVFWTFARGEANALFLGEIPKGLWKTLWIRRHAGPAKSGSSYPKDNYVLGFKVRGTAGASQPPPPQPTPTQPPPTEPPPGGGGASVNDLFGVRMIYPTKPEVRGLVSSPWYMKMSDPNSDVRFDPQATIARNADGSWRVTGKTGVRLKAFIGEIEGNNRTIINNAANNLDTYDHSEWARRGYIYAQNDWKNCEITGYFKVVRPGTAGVDANFNLYTRGIRHNSTVAEGCGGSAYKADLHENDTYSFTKEMFHSGDVPCGDRSERPDPEGPARGTIGAYVGRWVGLKFVLWNYIRQSDNKLCVHLESWADKDANNTWRMVGEQNDEGGWYPGAPSTSCNGDEHCGAERDQIITWGGPIAEFRWDDYEEVHFKWLSCREIGGTAVPTTGTLPRDVFGISELYATNLNGKKWASTAWNNGISRTIQNVPIECTADPHDPKLFVDRAGGPVITINGQGIMKTDGESPRVVVLDSWQNVEATVYIKCSAATKPMANFDIRSKTDHFCVTSGALFGGYIHNISFAEDNIHLRKEKSHATGYSDRQNQKTLTLPTDKWIGVKAVLYNLGNGHVKLETWIDLTEGLDGGIWTKQIEATDNGAWGGSGAGSPDTHVCKGSAIRSNMANGSGFLEYKWWTIREINPP